MTGAMHIYVGSCKYSCKCCALRKSTSFMHRFVLYEQINMQTIYVWSLQDGYLIIYILYFMRL